LTLVNSTPGFMTITKVKDTGGTDRSDLEFQIPTQVSNILMGKEKISPIF